MTFRRTVSALALAGAMILPAVPALADIYEDVGVIIGVRGYALEAMRFCAEKVGADAAYSEASDAWRAANAEGSKMVDEAIAKLGGVSAEEQAQFDKIINDKVAEEITGQSDAAAFCKKFAGQLTSGVRDIKALPPASEAMDRIRQMMQEP